MPEPTKAELAGEITKRLQELETAIATSREVTTFRLEQLETQLGERVKVAELHQTRVSELSEKVARIDERVRTLEKQSDRSWQVWLALIGAGLALLVALLKK